MRVFFLRWPKKKKKRKNTKIEQIQTEGSLRRSAKSCSCWGTLRNFKTTPVRKRKTYFHLPMNFSPTCLTTDCPQLCHTKKKSPLFLPVFSSEKSSSSQLSALFTKRRARRMFEAIFIKAWEFSWTRPLSPRPRSSLAETGRGVNKAFPEVARGRGWFQAGTPFWAALPTPVM